ncbi:MAG: polyphosphate kinase 2 family protein [Bacteroidales bacterium]|nr:polyphosphate kinase 2 family protein [Bacteroidales bacterium]
MSSSKINSKKFKVKENEKISLKDFDPGFCGEFENKKQAEKQLEQDIQELSELQYQLYAENKQSLLVVFQAMDAAGKDGAIKHVFSGVNPQGCSVHSFKKPSANELEHDFFWRHYKALPQRGEIGIFNRSHYENVLITKVHPEFILGENLPHISSVNDIDKDFWTDRYKQINNFEKIISKNGTTVIKFFLHLSKEEQKLRFLERIENTDKNWKFSAADIAERTYWDSYQKVYAEAISNTSTEYAPWYIIPADNKWFSRVAIGSIVVETLKNMNIKMPVLSEKETATLADIKLKLLKD